MSRALPYNSPPEIVGPKDGGLLNAYWTIGWKCIAKGRRFGQVFMTSKSSTPEAKSRYIELAKESAEQWYSRLTGRYYLWWQFNWWLRYKLRLQ